MALTGRNEIWKSFEDRVEWWDQTGAKTFPGPDAFDPYGVLEGFMGTGIAPQSVLNGNSLYYRLYLSNEDWHTASKKASAAGGYLLSVDNQQEQDFISQNIGVFFS